MRLGLSRVRRRASACVVRPDDVHDEDDGNGPASQPPGGRIFATSAAEVDELLQAGPCSCEEVPLAKYRSPSPHPPSSSLAIDPTAPPPSNVNGIRAALRLAVDLAGGRFLGEVGGRLASGSRPSYFACTQCFELTDLAGFGNKHDLSRGLPEAPNLHAAPSLARFPRHVCAEQASTSSTRTACQASIFC